MSRSILTGRRRRVATGALAGALVLGAAGAAHAATQDAPDSASALVFSAPDPTIVERTAAGLAGGDPAGRNIMFLEGELAFLNSSDLADQVRRSLTGSGQPDLEAIRLEDSNVLEVTATHADAGMAARQAQAAAEAYVRSRQARLVARIDALTASVDEQIAATDAAITALGPPPTQGVDPEALQRAALQRQYTGNLVTRDRLQRELAVAPQSASVVQQSAALPGGALPAATTAAVGAASLGGFAGAALMALTGSMRNRVRDEADVAVLGAPLVTPSLPASRPSGGPAAELQRAVHLQSLHMPAGPANGGSLAVVGPTTGVGASFLALQHARHAARRRPTLLVSAGGYSVDLDKLDISVEDVPLGPPPPTAGRRAGEPVRGIRRTSVPGLFVLTVPVEADSAGVEALLTDSVLPAAAAAGWAVVLDPPPLERSPMAVPAARCCRERVVVAAVGRSSVDDVEWTLRLLRSAGIHAGVVLNHSPRSALQRRGGHRVGALTGTASTTLAHAAGTAGDSDPRRGLPG